MVAALSRKELIRKFKTLGYSGPFSGGKNQFMIIGTQKIRIPNPHVGNIGVGLLKEILRQAGISPQEWDSMQPSILSFPLNYLFLSSFSVFSPYFCRKS